MNPMKYIQLAALGVVVAMAISLKVLWGWNQDLKAENLLLETQVEINETNMGLLTTLLDNERNTREAAQTALNDLRKDVPDVVYSQELPPSIQGVLDRFNESIRN